MYGTDAAKKQSSEIFIGLTGAVGTDLDGIAGMFDRKLQTLGYRTKTIILSKLLEDIEDFVSYDKNDECARIASLMDGGDELRRKTQLGSALAKLAISSIIEFRERTTWPEKTYKQAYILKSLKHEDEVRDLRLTYGNNFWLASVYSSRDARYDNLAKRIKTGNDQKNQIEDLMRRDEHDGANILGQNVRDVFPEGDVFLNADLNPNKSIERFIELLFGNTFHTPTQEELGMMHAFTVSRASSSLSRQVGAAILSDAGDLSSTGINEVPKAHGGHYIAGDENDAREFIKMVDSNTKKKIQGLKELFFILNDQGWLVKQSPESLADKALKLSRIRGSTFLNVIEYSREGHAESSALSSALRMGIPVTGHIMYCTTFPCHMCAKQIVASGISKVVYIEPYPKSLAAELHGDSIIMGRQKDSKTGKISFEPFIGIAPKRYMELFEMMQRKDEYGNMIPWTLEKAIPRWQSNVRYLKMEEYVSVVMKGRMKKEGLKLKYSNQ